MVISLAFNAGDVAPLAKHAQRPILRASIMYTKRDRRIRSGFLACSAPALLAINSKLSSAVHLPQRNKFNGTGNS
jgi:hypothetical protein